MMIIVHCKSRKLLYCGSIDVTKPIAYDHLEGGKPFQKQEITKYTQTYNSTACGIMAVSSSTVNSSAMNSSIMGSSTSTAR